MPRSITLVPTRELAAQVVAELEKFSKVQKFKVVQIIGGEGLMEQERSLLKVVDVIIATPGRLLDFLGKGKLILNEVKFFVIDEADKMLDMGFLEDVEKIMGYLPKTRQTALFSATFSPAILNLSKKLLNFPQQVMVSPSATTAATVTQYFINTSLKSKETDLQQLLKQEGIRSGIIFCNRKRDIQGLLEKLKQWGCRVGCLHGDLTQQIRTQTWQSFKDGEIEFLIASDVAARGLDSEGLDVVINYDVPNSSDDYVHRIGRTGRAGKEGKSYTLCMSTDKKTLTEIEKIVKTTLSFIQLENKEKTVSQEETPSEKKPKSKKSKTHIQKVKIVETPEVAEENVVEIPVPQPSVTKHPPKETKKSVVTKSQNGHNIMIEEPSVNQKGFGDNVPAFMKATWKEPAAE